MNECPSWWPSCLSWCPPSSGAADPARSGNPGTPVSPPASPASPHLHAQQVLGQFRLALGRHIGSCSEPRATTSSQCARAVLRASWRRLTQHTSSCPVAPPPFLAPWRVPGSPLVASGSARLKEELGLRTLPTTQG